MKISDLLRKAADIIAQSEGGMTQPEQPEAGDLAPVPCDNVDGSDSATMISPLQQKHELLKKVSGVDNNSEKFDDFETDDGSCENAPDPNDELDVIRQLTGIQTEQDDAVHAAHFIADDHESD